MPSLDTKDWKLKITADFTCKTKPIFHLCSYCNGNGTVGGGFKSLDGPQDCPTCHGSGGWNSYDHIEEKPKMPDDFIEHMRNAYKEYLNR